MQLFPNLYRVPNVVANVFVLCDPAGITLVDTGLPYSHKPILNYLRGSDHKHLSVRHILITHADRDHMGSVAALRKLTGARVYAGRLEGEAMAEGQETRRLRVSGFSRLALGVLRPLFAKARPAQADEFLEDGQVLPIFGGLRVLATPGHTPGHLSFFAEAHGILFAGDSLRASAQRQYALHPRVVCCGHGPAVFL